MHSWAKRQEVVTPGSRAHGDCRSHSEKTQREGRFKRNTVEKHVQPSLPPWRFSLQSSNTGGFVF